MEGIVEVLEWSLAMKEMEVRLLVMDVDGTMTDGGIYLEQQNIESKKFNTKDGLGIKLAQLAGIDVMIVTGRTSQCVSNRADELKITLVYQGIKDKRDFLIKFMQEHGYDRSEAAYIGDDLNDLPAMSIAGTTACPSDAAEEVKKSVTYLGTKRGGDGAVREFVEELLKRQGKWDEVLKQFFARN